MADIWPASADRLRRTLVLGTALWCVVLAGAHAAEQGTSSRRAAYSGRVQVEPAPNAGPEAALAAPRAMRVSTATQVQPPSDPNEPLFREANAADAAAPGHETASTHTGKTSRPGQMVPAGGNKVVANKAVGRAADGASARSKARTSAASDRTGARHGKADQAGKAVKRTAAVGRSSHTRREAERVALRRGAVHKPAAGHIDPRTGRSLAGRSRAVRRPLAHTRQAKAPVVTTSRHAARPAVAQPSGKPARQATRRAAVRPGSHHASARHSRPAPADVQRQAKPRG